MNKTAFALILVLGILTVLIVAGSAVVNLTSGETRMVKVQNNSIRAFYLGEAGIEEAISHIRKGDDYNDFSGALYNTISEYSVDIAPNTIPSPSPSITTYTIDSSGAYPNLSASDKITRRVRANIDVRPKGNQENVINAIEVNGELKISSAVVINGGVRENTTLDFQSIFGITKEEMETMADNKYTDPENNKIPVDKITWVNLINQAEFRISKTGWSGSGILVVREPEASTSPVLEIEGGTFNGVIWVIGNLRISGNAVINGAIFVEGGSAEVTKLTGTPVISYDGDQVAAAFSCLGNSVIRIYNWQEIQ